MKPFEIHCSKLARPMACAGYCHFEDLPDFPVGPEADEGTAAGELFERFLLGSDIPARARNNVHFTEEMYYHIKPIAEEIHIEREGNPVTCEERIDWQSRSGVWVRGKFDSGFVRDRNLFIDDLKYGWGIVEAKENWQLLGYAIGKCIRDQIAPEKIILRIRQPRPHHEDGPKREWVLSYADLLAYKDQIDDRLEQIANGYNHLQTGKQCRYCPAVPEACPAFNRLFYRALEVSTEFFQDQIDEKTLADQLDHANRAQEVIKIKMDSLQQLAAMRVKAGKVIPGWITEERFGDRRWKSEITPEVIETLTGKNVVKQEMMSPAQCEKIGIDKKFINALVERRFLGVKMAKKDAGEIGDKIFGKGAPTRG